MKCSSIRIGEITGRALLTVAGTHGVSPSTAARIAITRQASHEGLDLGVDDASPSVIGVRLPAAILKHIARSGLTVAEYLRHALENL